MNIISLISYPTKLISLPFNCIMKRTLLIFILITTCVLGLKAQEEVIDNDTNYYVSPFDRDTNARVHIGAILGIHYQGIDYQVNSEPIYADSVNNWSSDNHIGFSFGIIVDVKLNDHFNLESGVHVMISKLQLNFTSNATDYEPITNYSTLQIPAWINYAPKVTASRFFFGTGLTYTTDVSRRDEKYNRNILLSQSNLMAGVGVGYRMRLPSLSYVNFNLQFHYGLLNMVAKSDNYYNQAIDKINNWDISLYISMN